MLQSLLPFLAAFASGVSALAYNAPLATSRSEPSSSFTFPPDPTPPAIALPELFKRQEVFTAYFAPDNTCGYFSGLDGAGFICNPSTATCVFLPVSSVYGAVGCCVSANCAFRTACVGYTEFFSSSLCDNGCQKNTYTLKCTSKALPYCASIRFTKEGVQDFFCDSVTITTWQLASTTFNGERDGRSFTPIDITITSATSKSSSTTSSTSKSTSTSTLASTSTSTPASTPASTPIPNADPATSGSASSSTQTTAPAASSSSSTPIAPIVGGAVGGFAALAIIGVAVFFIVRRNKKNGSADNNAPPPTYAPPPDPNGSAYTAAIAGKPQPTAQEPGLAGYWSPQQQGPYHQPQMSQTYQPVPVQQYPVVPPVPELQEGRSYGQPPVHQGWPSSPSNPGLMPNPNYSQPASNPTSPNYSQPASNPTSPTSQTHLTAVYHNHQSGNGLTTPHSQRDSTLTQSEPPQSPMPTYAAYQPPHPGVAEMSPNMAGGPFPQDLHYGTYEVPGSEPYRTQGPS